MAGSAEQLVSTLTKLEAPGLSIVERFELEVACAKLLYSFGFKQFALRMLKSLSHDYPNLESLTKLLQTLDPTWTGAGKTLSAVTKTFAEAEFDISVLDEDDTR